MCSLLPLPRCSSFPRLGNFHLLFLQISCFALFILSSPSGVPVMQIVCSMISLSSLNLVSFFTILFVVLLVCFPLSCLPECWAIQLHALICCWFPLVYFFVIEFFISAWFFIFSFYILCWSFQSSSTLFSRTVIIFMTITLNSFSGLSLFYLVFFPWLCCSSSWDVFFCPLIVSLCLFLCRREVSYIS